MLYSVLPVRLCRVAMRSLCVVYACIFLLYLNAVYRYQKNVPGPGLSLLLYHTAYCCCSCCCCCCRTAYPYPQHCRHRLLSPSPSLSLSSFPFRLSSFAFALSFRSSFVLSFNSMRLMSVEFCTAPTAADIASSAGHIVAVAVVAVVASQLCLGSCASIASPAAVEVPLSLVVT